MKRISFSILIIITLAFVAVSLPSCKSSKKDDSAYYNSKVEQIKKGKTKHDRNDNHSNGVTKSGKKIVKEAYGWLGTPYGYGRAEKGVACDCSGMVMSVYEKVTGIKLPRNSAKQMEFCKSIKRKDVKVGDLCFFATGKDPDKVSHVGIMIDDNNFIHSSTSKGVVVSDITQPYYVRTFKGFGRVSE
ncbi:MAG: C40 family peptidase [Muribaculaceae bacterium]|nr:C40 family peptidase [Muribaculaceae bacterium]